MSEECKDACGCTSKCLIKCEQDQDKLAEIKCGPCEDRIESKDGDCCKKVVSCIFVLMLKRYRFSAFVCLSYNSKTSTLRNASPKHAPRKTNQIAKNANGSLCTRTNASAATPRVLRLNVPLLKNVQVSQLAMFQFFV